MLGVIFLVLTNYWEYTKRQEMPAKAASAPAVIQTQASACPAPVHGEQEAPKKQRRMR